MKILVICPYPFDVAAGQRLKFEQYYDSWRANGYTVIAHSFMSPRLWLIAYKKGYLMRKIYYTILAYFRRCLLLISLPKYDIVYVFMWVSPFGPPLLESIVKLFSKKVIYDIEDNLLDCGKDHCTSLVSRLMQYLKSTSRILYLIENSHYVITSSPELESKCRELNNYSASRYITSSVDIFRYIPSPTQFERKVCIGWTGTFSSLPYLRALEPVFQALAELRPYKLLVIGNFDYSLEGVDHTILQWNKYTEIQDLQCIDIGVYPLPNDDWVSGKSGLKAIQYMAMGIPVVASNSGHTPNVVLDGQTGFLVNTTSEWINCLIRLIDDPELRTYIGSQGRNRVLEHYSTKCVASQYLSVLNSLACKS